MTSLMAQADYAQAESLWRETLAIRRKQFGDEYHSVAEALDRLAMTLDAQGNSLGTDENRNDHEPVPWNHRPTLERLRSEASQLPASLPVEALKPKQRISPDRGGSQ